MTPLPYPDRDASFCACSPNCSRFVELHRRTSLLSVIGREVSRTSATTCSLNSGLYFDAGMTQTSSSHVRINSGFSPLSTKHRALQSLPIINNTYRTYTTAPPEIMTRDTFWSTLKTEFYNRHQFTTRQSAMIDRCCLLDREHLQPSPTPLSAELPHPRRL